MASLRPRRISPPAQSWSRCACRHEGEELGFISTVTTFGTALDVTVSELSIEAFFPADAPTERRLRAIGDRGSPSPP